MGFIMLLPILAAIIGLITALFCFIGICLILIGVTGMVMNKIYIKQTKSEHGISNSLCNISSIIFGIGLILFPLGYVLYGIIASLIK